MRKAAVNSTLAELGQAQLSLFNVIVVINKLLDGAFQIFLVFVRHINSHQPQNNLHKNEEAVKRLNSLNPQRQNNRKSREDQERKTIGKQRY